MKNVTKKGKTTELDRGASDVKGRKRGATRLVTRRQKQDCGAGLQRPTRT